MRVAFVLICAALAVPAASSAADGAVHGYTLAGLTQTQGRSTDANPNDLFDVSGGRSELALGLEGALHGWRWRARLTLEGGYGSDPSQRGGRLQQLQYDWRWRERWHFSAGQQLLAWDNGLSFQPLGFFKSSRTNLSDVFDTEGRSQGLPMLVGTRLGDSITTDIVASVANPGSDAVERRNARQVAVRWSGEPVPGLNMAFILRQRAGARIGAGVSSSYGVGEATLRADAYFGPAEARLFPVALVDGPAQLYTPPLTSSVDPGGAYRIRSALGATWTPQRGLGLYGEWLHHGDGLSSRQWDVYRNQLELHANALNGPQRAAAIGNLGTDLGVLSSTAAGVRRDYLYLRAELGQGDAAWYLSTLAGLADGSTLTTLSKSWQIRRHTTLRTNLSAFTGHEGSEFGLIPIRFQGSLLLLHTF